VFAFLPYRGWRADAKQGESEVYVSNFGPKPQLAPPEASQKAEL